jgi:hypothetical protein
MLVSRYSALYIISYVIYVAQVPFLVITLLLVTIPKKTDQTVGAYVVLQ